MTLDELKAKHAAMTPGKLTVVPAKISDLYYVETDDPVSGFPGMFASWMRREDAAGIVAIHNLLPAFMRRYEEMAAALRFVVAHECEKSCTPCYHSAKAALANANKPLEAKAENDERFTIERDETRDELAKRDEYDERNCQCGCDDCPNCLARVERLDRFLRDIETPAPTKGE